MEIGAYSHKGDREINEDNFFINNLVGVQSLEIPAQAQKRFWLPQYLLCGVLDGIGGGEFGERASLLAAQTGAQWGKRPFSPQAYTSQVNQRICDLRMTHQFCSIGTTAVVFCVEKGVAQVYNIGDSPCYRLRKGQLTCLSTYHTKYVEFLSESMVSQHLGLFEHECTLEPSVSVLGEVEKGDVYLLCSDGVSTQMSQEDLMGHLQRGDSAKTIAMALVTQAIQHPHSDNATALVVRI